MSIYKLKLAFLDFLMIFGHSKGAMGWPISKHYVLGPLNEVLKPRKSDFPIGPTSNNHNSLNMSPN